MARTPKGNNAFALASGARTASHSTHGVVCASRDCRTFDPNISQKHEGTWRCERHGGANNHARANAKDDEFANGIPGAARRARFARFRAKQKKQNANAYSAHIPSFLDRKPVERRHTDLTPVAQKATKSPAQLRREAALAELGLSEADIRKFIGA